MARIFYIHTIYDWISPGPVYPLGPGTYPHYDIHVHAKYLERTMVKTSFLPVGSQAYARYRLISYRLTLRGNIEVTLTSLHTTFCSTVFNFFKDIP